MKDETYDEIDRARQELVRAALARYEAEDAYNVALRVLRKAMQQGTEEDAAERTIRFNVERMNTPR